ncbi:L-threonylcarbamoyladenylate synthase [Nematocida homosporus]|uniref:L-threonylcarbamoyladenylate synthase n=1 Tax=Nematocida homosporus TaxID=1912981 RepID=UPI0022200D29|nr:L-threonylcarbamoyladenylate synthase [Nematocida homosporus]KAI5184622.1 L-threonylcarbamoyladenylate synthase [Nematocida homosporus]
MHHTEILSIDGNLDRIVAAFQNNPVAFPTETVYGLGAIVWREDLIKRVFAIKNRPNDNPLIVHVSSLAMLRRCIAGEIPAIYQEVIDLYWPGPLTLLFKRSASIPDWVTAGGEYVAIRIPDHQVTLKIIDKLDAPLVGPSANKSTRPSPTTAQHVLDDLAGDIPLIVDGGPCQQGVESTVINGLVSPPLFLRPGAITFETLQAHIPDLVLVGAKDKATKSCPGMRYKHYAPSIPVLMIQGAFNEQITKLHQVLAQSPHAPPAIGLLLPESHLTALSQFIPNDSNYTIYSLGHTIKDHTHKLFDGLRYLDRHCEVIYCVSIPATDEGRALMDRLSRAATEAI